ncbi:MAG: hypothetical protein LUD81_06785, partial [Clostridiales bacterium]|nr:hypothetical protein [Clostridiales bacterium]
MIKRVTGFLLAVIMCVSTITFCSAQTNVAAVASVIYNGHSYSLYDYSITWPEAETYCENLRGHLVTITSSGEQSAIEGLLDYGSKKQYWMGMTTASQPKWVTGETYSYSNWDRGEPNNSSRADGQREDYVHIYNNANPAVSGSKRFKWNDMFYDNTYPKEESNFSLNTVGFICEWDYDKTGEGFNAVTATSDEVLAEAGFDSDDLKLLENITLGKDTIKGPSVTIFNKTFYLLELDGKLNIKLGDKLNLQFKVDEEEKTVQALVGFKNLSEEAEIGQDKWQDMYKEVKDLYKAFNNLNTNKNTYNKLRKLNTSLRDIDANIFLNIEGKFAGYLEWAYESGSFNLAEGGIIVTAKASGKFSTRLAAFPASYGTVSLEVSTQGKIKVADDKDYDALSVSSDLEFKPEFSFGMGLGSKSLHLEGGFKGNILIKVIAVTGYFGNTVGVDYDPFTVTAEGSLYVEGKAGIFTASKDWPVYGPKQWFPGEAEAEEVSLASVEEDEFKPISRDYLNNPGVMTFSFDPSTSFSKAGLYPYNSPQLAMFDDGSRLLVWTDDDGTKGDTDVTSLYYSTYTESAGWSEYNTIYDNEGYNGDPVVYCDGTKAYILWARVAESLPEDISLEEHMAKTDLYCSVYDGETISEPVLVSSSNRLAYENIYDIAAEGDTIAVCWVENSENDLFMTEGTNTVYLRKYTGGAWQEEEVIGEYENAATNIKAGVSGQNIRVIYTLYNDDETTSLHINENGEEIYNGSYTNDCDELQVLGDEIYHIADGELYIYNILTGTDTAAGVSDLSNFEIIENGGERVLLTLVSTGFGCEMYGTWYDSENGSFGNIIQLTDYEKYIRNYSAELKDDGNVLMAVNLIEINDKFGQEGGTPYAAAELKVIEGCEYNDLVLNYVTYDGEDIAPGADLPLDFNVTNNSLNSIDTVYASVSDENGGILGEGTLSCEIAAGESSDLSLDITLPDSLSRQSITLNISCDYDDMDETNNSAETELGLADIVISDLVLKTDDNGAAVTAYVKNNGYETAENIVLTVYNSNASGTVLGTFDIGSLDSQEDTAVEFTLPAKYYH